jgi:hypothetical protein
MTGTSPEQGAATSTRVGVALSARWCSGTEVAVRRSEQKYARVAAIKRSGTRTGSFRCPEAERLVGQDEQPNDRNASMGCRGDGRPRAALKLNSKGWLSAFWPAFAVAN